MKKTISLILIWTFILSLFTRAAVVDSSDGGAFVRKDEFEALKTEFDEQLSRYNDSISEKVDGKIANYIKALVKGREAMDSTLNKFSKDRRTFTQSIANPTTCTQDDIYIETAGYWVASYPYCGTDKWGGYALCGINNYDGGHQKQLWPKNNGKVSKYVFLDTTKVDKQDYLYINDYYRKKIQYYIYVSGAQTADDTPWTEEQHFGGPTSMSWNATYNWSGSNDRQVTAEGTTVNCTEVIMLQIYNDDYDTSTSGTQDMTWAKGMSGSTIYTSQAGCLEKKNRLNWSYRKTDFDLGWKSGQQVRVGKYGTASYGNNYNSEGAGTAQVIPLSFNVPKITMYEGNKIIVKDVSDMVGKPVYYYSGLPVCTVPEESKNLTIKIKPTINRKNASDSKGMTLAIKNSQFKNDGIASEPTSDIYYINTWTTAPTEITIDIDEDELIGSRGQPIWIKAIATDTDCTVTLETTEVSCY